jgi:GGDEF domain-containing protein
MIFHRLNRIWRNLQLNTKLSDAEVLSERLRKRVAGHEFPVVGHLTVSFGVAQYQRGDSADSFLAHVDKCMYLAKQHGRNTVETC